MSKYLRKFETTAEYESAESTLVKPNVSYIVKTNEVEFNPWVAPMNIITYEADAKLTETTDEYEIGLHTNAFSGTSGQLTMTSHTFENGVGTIEFNDDVTSIGYQAFFYCTGLTSVTIPNSVTSIGSYAFQSCTGLTSITIPNSVTSIGSSAFEECTGLTSVTIGSGVTSIGGYAFQRCSGLASITIPNSVTSIGSSAFNACSGLTSIVVDSANTVYDSRNNCNAIINTSTNELIAGCKNTVIPNTVTSIGNEAFANCKSLTSITIPDSVTSIGGFAFGSCEGLTSITIGSGVISIGEDALTDCYLASSNFVNNSSLDEESNNYWGAIIVDEDINGLLIMRDEVVKYRGTSDSVTIPNTVRSIGDGAFQRCSNLASITIPSSVTSIGDSAFWKCSGLTSIISLAMTAPTIESHAFQDVRTGGTLTVPTGSTGYNVWMGTGNYYLGKYNWTKVEQ